MEDARMLTLGTAQLGLKYGIANQVPRMTTKMAFKILDAAWDAGIRRLDTCPAYGDCEERIIRYMRNNPGRRFHITTKIYKDWPETLFLPSDNKADAYLYYWSSADDDETRPGPEEIDGISLYTEQEVEETKYDYGIYELPASALDGRNDKIIKKLCAVGKFVQVRSLLIQGLVTLDPDDCPIERASHYICGLQEIAADYSMNVVELCVRWFGQLNGARVAIVGAETPSQTAEVTEYFARGWLQDEIIAKILKLRKGVPDEVVSPKLWKQAPGFSLKK